jgi:integrase/recombinase XerC
VTSNPPTATDVEAIRALLDRLGIRPELLLTQRTPRSMPTFDAYIDHVLRTLPQSTARAYGPYFRRLRIAWPDRTIDEPTSTDLKEFVLAVKDQVVVRRNARGGRTAMEHMVGAFRCLYRHAVDEGLIRPHDNPAERVEKPRRLPSNRYALPAHQLAEINDVAATTGNDPELDTLLLRLHTETACRRGGALALRPADLNPDLCVVRLREKGETERDQPVSPTLMNALVRHATVRGTGNPNDQLLRQANGKPISRRRYNYLWERLGRHLPWVRAQGVSMHWLRVTTLTWVERNFGYGVARAFAGHNDRRSDAGTTTTYIRADLYEVAQALAVLAGESHPLLTIQDTTYHR